MKHNLGILLNNYFNNQMAYYSISNGNKLLKRPDVDITFFYENLSPVTVPACASMMNISESYNFTGILIACDIELAAKIIRHPSASKKYFLSSDLYWLRHPKMNYENYASIYRDSSLEVLARSQEHSDIIRKAFNLSYQPKVFGDFNYEVILDNDK